MRFDDLTKPVSPDAPCGEDLLDTGDNDFLAYYYDAEAKMPDRYVSLATGEPFDRATVDLKSEQKAIAGLLSRTRDLRLLALDARFSILAGRIKPFCEAVIAMADLLEEFPDDVHPRAGEDPFERQAAIEFLDTRATTVTPLDYAPIVVDRRAGEISRRGYLVGSGQVEARTGETAGDAAAMLAALGSPDNASDVDAIHELLKAAADAVSRIEAASAGFSPSLDNLKTKLPEIIGFIEQSRSDLAGEGPEAGTEASPSGESLEAEPGGDAAAASGPPAAAGSVQSHADARAALAGTLAYFRDREPSSPALILVRQALALVGRPLVEALEILLQGASQNAVIDLGSDTGFKIPMGRMIDLSQAAMNAGPQADTPAPEPREVASRDQALAEIKAVEAFFKAMEPASPIPVLMFKARSFLNSDFQSIVRDLIPAREGGD